VGYQLGVDLGTTYTAAAVIRDGRAEVATLGTRSLEIPSVVLLRDDGELLFGEAAERRSQTEPHRFAREFKRRMGDPTPILLGGSPFSAHALTAHLLRGVVKVVADREGGPPDHTVVTCPANWGDYKRDLLDQAVRQADIGRVGIATEPEAAAVHYASTTRVAPGEVVAVYDLGGGTFDAAVLRNTGAGFELLGDPRGIEQLGGVYFDEAVFAWVVDHMADAMATLDPDDPGAMAAVDRLRRDCVEAKESLSWDTDTTIPVALPNRRTEVRLTRGEFEDMIRPTLVDTVEALHRSLASAGLRPDDLTSVLLVGGSSRIPLVGQMLVNELRRPVAIDVHPKHAVALGAARLAAADSGSIARPAPGAPAPATTAPAATATLEPTQVTRAGRTVVTSPAGVVAGTAPPSVPVVAPPLGTGTEPADHRAGARHGGPYDDEGPYDDGPYGARLPRAGANGGRDRDRDRRPPASPPEPRRGGRSPLVLVGAGVAVVVALVAAAVFALGGSDGDDEPQADGAATPTPTDGGTVAGTPADFPRGAPLAASTLAYTQVEGTFWNVWLVEADGSNPRPLTRETEDKARLPVLSPDRTAVAYSVETAGGWELRVIDSGGQGDRVVSGDIVPDARATWSPDGGRMAFVGDRDGPADIYVLDLASGELTNITNSPEDEGDPAWSPDGRSIAYWSLLTGNQEIFVVPAAGGEPTQLTRQPGDDADPAWHPQSSSLAFASQRDGDWEIYVMGADGQGQQQLTDDPSDEQDPAWSPDGAYIAFESKRDSADRPDNDWSEIYVMLQDGRDQVRVTARDGFDAHPAWGLSPPA
jgi:molecular chaperone DnaK